PLMGIVAEAVPGVALSNVTRLFVFVSPITNSARARTAKAAKPQASKRELPRRASRDRGRWAARTIRSLRSRGGIAPQSPSGAGKGVDGHRSTRPHSNRPGGHVSP